MLKNILILIHLYFIISDVIAGSNSFIYRNDSSIVNDSCKIQLYFGGDVTFANHFERFVGHNYQYAFGKLDWFKQADLSMVNLENPLTKRGRPVEKQFNFRALPEYTQILKQAGIDIVTIANNHIYDYSDQGLFDTVDYLDSSGIDHVGAGRSLTAARKPVIYDIKGVKIGFLAYYGLHKHSDCHPATVDSAGTALRKLSYINEDIKKLKENADFIIVNFHWGMEKENLPGEDQIDFAHRVIDFGADLIVGHHPHVLQGIEIYKDKAIVYSLGNFIFGGNSRKTYQTAVLGVEIKNCDTGGFFKINPIPIRVDYWQPYKAQKSDSLQIMQNLIDYSSIFEQSIF
ncbi:MAG: CapA family protein [Calditrichaceae bacterium]|jgi:poly-gamma-glutamate capsule biosynthesis protein CapA/YwtB (metallophosphatase superfamily)